MTLPTPPQKKKYCGEEGYVNAFPEVGYLSVLNGIHLWQERICSHRERGLATLSYTSDDQKSIKTMRQFDDDRFKRMLFAKNQLGFAVRKPCLHPASTPGKPR